MPACLQGWHWYRVLGVDLHGLAASLFDRAVNRSALFRSASQGRDNSKPGSRKQGVGFVIHGRSALVVSGVDCLVWQLDGEEEQLPSMISGECSLFLALHNSPGASFVEVKRVVFSMESNQLSPPS